MLKMKVIKHGKTFQHECIKCGCIFEYGYPDLITKKARYSDFTYVNCPECDRKFYLRANIDGEDRTDVWNR